MIKPILDQTFKPAIIAIRDFNKKVSEFSNKQHIIIAVERDQGYIYRREFDILPDGVDDKLNNFIIERFIKSILWLVGGFKIYIAGSHKVYEAIKLCYSPKGQRAFDYDFMSTCYERPVEVVECTYETIPLEKSCSIPLGGNLNGRRIGFDAGGSDRKTSAVLNGKTIYSEEVVWQPKLQEDIQYHYDEIYTAFKTSIDKLGGDVDYIGVSTAGVIINNRPMVSSLFIKTKKEDFERQKLVYIATIERLEKELGHKIPYVIANDGDVTALAGALDLKDNCVLGIAMGTSEAVGYVNKDGNLNGWLSELAFVPVDFQDNAPVDEWSHDYGVGCKYFSQDAVIRLAEQIGVKFSDNISLGEKLKAVQKLAKERDEDVTNIFRTIGVYLAYTIAYYAEFYEIKHLMLLGRVMSGIGGDIVLKTAKETLEVEFPEYKNINLCTPSEYMRRVGQSIAAASLAKK